MRIKQHISGVAIAYSPIRKGQTVGDSVLPSRPQGSLVGYQRRQIADAIEYMRRYAVYKPRIFVLTSPGFTDRADEMPLVSKWVNAMRMRHGLGNYVWVRELTGNGYPHFHFVADVPQFDPVKQSLLWSSYFGSDSKASIRLGSKKDKNGRRKYWVDSPMMANYLGVYLGKGFTADEEKGKRKLKRFAISQGLGLASSPAVYDEKIVETIQGYHERQWDLTEAPDWLETEGQINTKSYHWKKANELFPVYIGYKKRLRRT